jgi:hypothetical protein
VAGTMKELHESRTFDVDVNGGTATFRYVLWGETDEATAYDLVLATSPGTWYSYTRTNINMDDRPNLGLWFPVVTYKIPAFAQGSLPSTGTVGIDTAPASSPSSPAPTGTDPLTGINFTVTTEMQRIYRSFSTVSSGGLDGEPTPPDFNKLIGVDSEGRAEGVDVPTPVASFRKRAVLQGINQQYFRNLLRVVGKTNELAWWGFEAESLLFNGCTGQQRNDNEFEMEFEFKYAEPIPLAPGDDTDEFLSLRTIRPGLVVPEKAGWHYLWTPMRREIDPVSGLEVTVPYAYKVERVIGVSSFTWLGI